MELEVGEGDVLTKDSSVIEDLAYRDTWGSGTASYFHMLYERLSLLRDLMRPDASIYVHLGWQVSSGIRLVMDELFGEKNLRTEIIWQRTGGAHSDSHRYGIIHDTILFYSKSDEYVFSPVYTPYDEEYIQERFSSVEEGTKRRYWLNTMTAAGQGAARIFAGKPLNPPKGTHWRFSQDNIDEYIKTKKIVFTPSGKPYVKQYLDESPGKPAQSIWVDVVPSKSGAERTGFPTQKPEKLLDRILTASSNHGDLVADFFCGSGTTLAVAEKLGRKWIGCDLGRFSIHTSRKRLIGVQRELKTEGKPYRSFEILNLGKYERQYFVGIDHTLPEKERAALSAQKEEHYVTLILLAYKAERVFQSPPFHGRKG